MTGAPKMSAYHRTVRLKSATVMATWLNEWAFILGMRFLNCWS